MKEVRAVRGAKQLEGNFHSGCLRGNDGYESVSDGFRGGSMERRLLYRWSSLKIGKESVYWWYFRGRWESLKGRVDPFCFPKG